MTSRPLVSVVIPAFNCERYLAMAIESIVAQSYRPVEIIVVDDGSTDGSRDVAQRFVPSVQVLHQSNGGTGAARNRGIDAAKGSFLAFLDADDIWAKDKLTLQMAAFDADPELEVVFGHAKQFHSPELDEAATSRVRCSSDLVPARLSSAMLIKRGAFFRVGPFETGWRLGVDMSWCMRASELELRMLMLPQCVYMRRLHESNAGITRRDCANERIRVLKAGLDRRRELERTVTTKG